MNSKIKTLEELQKISSELKSSGKKVVPVTGLEQNTNAWVGLATPVKIDCCPKHIVVGDAIVPAKTGVVDTRTSIVNKFVFSQPFISVTVSSTTYTPELENTWETLVPVAVVPSPKSHKNVDVLSSWT